MGCLVPEWLLWEPLSPFRFSAAAGFHPPTWEEGAGIGPGPGVEAGAPFLSPLSPSIFSIPAYHLPRRRLGAPAAPYGARKAALLEARHGQGGQRLP